MTAEILDDGLVQVSHDGGSNWRKSERAPGLPDYGSYGVYVQRIFASKLDEDSVFALYDNSKNGDFKPYIYKSTNKAEADEEAPQTFLTISDGSGKVVRRLNVPGTRGMHKFVWNLRGVPPTAPGDGPGGGRQDGSPRCSSASPSPSGSDQASCSRHARAQCYLPSIGSSVIAGWFFSGPTAVRPL